MIKEICFRWLNSVMILVCCGGLVAAATLLVHVFEGYAKCEEAFAQTRQQALRASADSLWDTYRKITKSLGFNVQILPRDQNLSDFYASDYTSKTMPEVYARAIVNSGIITVEHITPSLFTKVYWPELRQSIIVCGTQGELAKGTAGKSRSAMIDPVPHGSAVAGYELARTLHLRQNSRIAFRQYPLVISSCNPQRGNKDDITLWVNLNDAQVWFKKEGLINSILALECRCSADKNLPALGKIRDDLENILPQTQVIEYQSEVLARAEERYQAEQTEKSVVEQDLNDRATLRRGRMRMTAWCLLFVFAGSVALIGLLMNVNVRERRFETGVLRALGISTTTILTLFVSKLALIGILSGATGYCSGWIASHFMQQRLFGPGFETGFSVSFFAIAILASTAIAVGAGWLPTLKESIKNTADLLQEAR